MLTAIFVGTFDPFHGAHIGQLLRAHRFLSFSKVYILVNKHPSHKPHASSWQDRVKMAQLTLNTFDLPFDYSVICMENSRAMESTSLVEEVDYRVTGIDSLIDNLSDPDRWIFAQRWPMIVLSIPDITELHLADAIATLPADVQQTILYKYVSEAAVPMMNYNFEQQTFISERVHSTHLRTGQNKAFIPSVVQQYIREHQLYKDS